MKMLLVFAFLLFGNFVLAQDLKLILNVEQTEMPVGIPIIFNLTIQGEKDFTLHGQFGFCDGHTGLMILDERGNWIKPILEMGCGVTEESPFDSNAKFVYKNSASSNFEFFLDPGIYKIKATYNSSGPYLDRYSETDQRPVKGIWIGKLTSNEVNVTVKNPEGEDQRAFLAHHLSEQEIAEVGTEFPWFLKIKGQQILQEYPKSNYAAWVQWKLGKIWFDEYGGSDSSVKEDFEYQNFMNGVDKAEPIVGGNIYREKIQKIIELWSPLYKDFPEFVYRPRVLQGLAQAFIRNAEYKNAQPMIKELLERYPQSKEATIASEYKKTLIEKGLWEE